MQGHKLREFVNTGIVSITYLKVSLCISHRILETSKGNIQSFSLIPSRKLNHDFDVDTTFKEYETFEREGINVH